MRAAVGAVRPQPVMGTVSRMPSEGPSWTDSGEGDVVGGVPGAGTAGEMSAGAGAEVGAVVDGAAGTAGPGV